MSLPPRLRWFTRWRFAGLVMLLLLASVPVVQAWQDKAAEREATEAQLEAIQRELERRQASQSERSQELSRTERQLQTLEEEIAAVAVELNDTDNALRRIEARIAELQAEAAQLEQQLQQQTQLLAQQVESAYRSGQYDFLKLLLSQTDPAEVQRMLSYYGYLNQARQQEIESVLALQRKLAEVRAEVETQQQALSERRAQQQRQQTVLRNQQQEQEALVAKLQRELASDQSRIEQLQADQEQLEQVLDAIIAALRNDVRLDGLADNKGKLAWPTEGRVQRLFATPKSGAINWKGVMIEGQLGQPVTSIADGRVLFANWMRGFGLVLVIDHGNGYMSLYGHNQTILPPIGSTVRAGETVALMGQSGGRSSPALYFEIRVKGEAVNPTQWCR